MHLNKFKVHPMIWRYTIVVIAILLTTACKNVNKQEKEAQPSEKEQTTNSTTVNKSPITGHDDVQMIRFEGNTFMMGSNSVGPRERPVHAVTVLSFMLDVHPVTVKQFRAFIEATGHTTEAERFKDSAVFDFSSGRWILLPGTTWEYPMGPQEKKAKDDHPVTHVSWNDAMAYAKWCGKRLPTEAEWEFAARNGGTSDELYPFGKDIIVDGKWQANVFQGTIQAPEEKDGYLYTAPAKSFAPSNMGLYGMTGNVWEWTGDVYKPYPGNAEPYQYNETVKTIRGGSFMYDEAGDISFSVFFRSSNSSETSLFNTGFRCAKSVN